MSNDHPEFDFENSLPAGREFFTVRFIALFLICSEDTVERLIQAGDLAISINIAPSTSTTKAMQRVTRKSLVDFLNKRKGQ